MYTLTNNGVVIATQAKPIDYSAAQYAWQLDGTLVCDTLKTMTVTFIKSPAQVQAEIVQSTQARLDNFARTRNYDGILSACTYASSSIPRFAVEGLAAVNARDATWATLYNILGQVQAGTRPVPIGFANIEADLPALVWPVP